MKVRQILLCAWRTYTAHFGALLQGFLLQAVVCLIALAPLLFLSVPQAAPLACGRGCVWWYGACPAWR